MQLVQLRYTKVGIRYFLGYRMNCKKFLLGAVTCAMVVSFEKVQATEVEQQKQKLLREFMLRQDVHLMISN